MEAAPSGPGLPKWNTFNYGMVCFYSIGLHASISLPYYMVKYSGKWGMHAVEGGFWFFFFFAVLNYKSALFQRDWRLSHRWCWIISCRKIDRILIRLRWLFSSYLSILHFILKLWIVSALGKHFKILMKMIKNTYIVIKILRIMDNLSFNIKFRCFVIETRIWPLGCNL